VWPIYLIATGMIPPRSRHDYGLEGLYDGLPLIGTRTWRAAFGPLLILDQLVTVFQSHTDHRLA
jgi:hypothetical protein